MKLKFKRPDGKSFLDEIGKSKKSVSVEVDDSTLDPKGRYSRQWNSMDVSNQEWSLVYENGEEFTLEFVFETNSDEERSLTPANFILWEGRDDGVILDEGDFLVNTI